jgi:hypothetical protein
MKNVLLYLCTLALLTVPFTRMAAQQKASSSASASESLLSDEINGPLPKWLRFSGEYRARAEGFIGGGFKADNEDAYLLSRLRLNMMIAPESWLKFGFQAQDAHVFWKNQNPPEPPYQDTMDLRLGYVEIGDVEKKTIGFRAGRQELAFGDERLIGNVNWVNTARSFDALRGTYRSRGLRVDLFAASVVNAQDGQFDRSANGNYLYGIYGGMAQLVPMATVEPYFLWRRSSGLVAENGVSGILNFGTVGLRVAGKLPKDWDYGVEMDRQAGSLGTDSIGAWAGHWVLGHTLLTTHYHPRVSLEYNYASGDDNPADGHRGTFDQLYPTGHDKYGMDDQVGWKNIRNARASLELKPGKKWLAVGRYDAWWLADPHDALYTAASAVVARSVSGLAGRFVGQELDGSLAYNLSRQFQFGGGYGHIFPGTFLMNATPGKSYSYPYVSSTFVF